MVGALVSIKMFCRAKHALGAYTIVKTINAISPIITLVSSPQWVYWSSF